MIKADIIADSLNERGSRLTTFMLTYPRIIHGEIMTHRVFSRNSASSRAIPFHTMKEMVEENPFVPIAWQKHHTGMQGSEYIKDSSKHKKLRQCVNEWLIARNAAIASAEVLHNINGVTKQLCNRLLEPFMWHTTLVTATDYKNFFNLRRHPDAEIHMQAIANAMWESYQASPTLVKAEDWHIPFGDKMNEGKIRDYFYMEKGNPDPSYTDVAELKIKIAVARCARLSYMTHENEINYKADIALFDRLLANKHMSPFEHVAVCTGNNKRYANFKGFKSYRNILKQ